MAAVTAGTVTGVVLVAAVAGEVFASSDLIDAGKKLYNNLKNETNTGFNFIEKGLKKVLGDKNGELAFEGANAIAIVASLPSIVRGITKLPSMLRDAGELLRDGKVAFQEFGTLAKTKVSDFFANSGLRLAYETEGGGGGHTMR